MCELSATFQHCQFWLHTSTLQQTDWIIAATHTANNWAEPRGQRTQHMHAHTEPSGLLLSNQKTASQRCNEMGLGRAGQKGTVARVRASISRAFPYEMASRFLLSPRFGFVVVALCSFAFSLYISTFFARRRCSLHFATLCSWNGNRPEWVFSGHRCRSYAHTDAAVVFDLLRVRKYLTEGQQKHGY